MAYPDTVPNLSSMGIYPFGSPQAKAAQATSDASNPFMSMMSAGSVGAPGGGMARISGPALGSFNYSQESQSYPTYLRNLGENQAQQAFQRQINTGIRMGSAAQGFQHAEDARNQSRLSYMGQAGQQELTVQQALALEQQRRNDEMLKRYGLDIQQRGQDMDYMSALLTAASSASKGGGGGFTIGGGKAAPFKPGVSMQSTMMGYPGQKPFTGLGGGPV